MEPKIDPLTLQLLEQRMRTSNPPTKTPRLSETKPSTTTETPEDNRMQTETPKGQYNTPIVSQPPLQYQIASNELLSGSEKENSKILVSLEPNKSYEDFFEKEEQKIETTDISYQSINQRGSNSIKKRKHEKLDKLDNTPDVKNNETLQMKTKKTKLTLPQAPLDGYLRTPDPYMKAETSGSGDEQLINKENVHLGTKKIYEFFSKKTGGTGTTTERASVRATGGRAKNKPHTVDKKQEIIEMKETGEERKELFGRIRELEDKLEINKKDREKDQIKASNEIKVVEEKFKSYKATVHKVMARNVLDIENYKRNERKSFLDRQRQRLGEYVSQREGSKFVDVWSDGSEIRSVKEQLENIMKEKDELEKQKKNIKAKKTPLSTSKSTETHILLPSIFNENSDSNSSSDIKETKERINAKITMLQREENILREQLEKLEVEKLLFYQQYKKQYEEDHSRYGRPNAETNAPAWPILNERYQLLSLLGKGGFSEVYKAYDLEELGPVACKVHQLNPNWTENAKTNYVKHANREFEVHKELNHPNIVRLFDCINIDDHSFATVLDYCEGPDLSMYLKQHKILPEKDAKVIIKQILAGLKYLSDHKTKIIHYDLKPQNVLFHKGEIKISDFGLCKIVDPDVSRIELTSQGVGTYWYLPPECFLMDDQPPLINNKVDVWSVGVMYFEMLFGMRPFGHNMSQEKILKEKVILKSYNVTFPTKPAVSAEAKDFIKKCLQYNQEDRMDIYEAYDFLYFGKK